MRAVSPAFVAALDAGERRLLGRVFMIFRDFSSICSATGPCLPATGNIFQANQVIDNRLCMQDFMGRPRPYAAVVDEPGLRFQTTNGTWINLVDSGIYPAVTDMALIPSTHTQKPGWWSASTSDALGNVDMTLTVSLSSTQSVNVIFYLCDPAWGVPTDFTLWAVHGSTRTAVATVVDNTDFLIFHEMGYYLQADTVQIQVTKWSRPNSHVKALQFLPLDGFEVTDRLVSWDMVEERNYTDQSSLPYGDSSKNKVTLVLDNTDGAFFSRNFKSPYYRKLRVNTKFRLFLGMYLPDETVEWTNRGAYYAIGNFDTSAKTPTVSIEAWDLSGRLDQTDYLAPVIYSLTTSAPNTILTLVDTVVSFYNQSFNTNLVVEDRTKFDDKGRYVSDWSSLFSYSPGSYPTSGVPNAYFPKQSYWKTLRDLADSILGWVTISEEETIIIDSEFMAKRTFNMLGNGQFELTPAVDTGWTLGLGSSLSYADQNTVFDGTNSGRLFTTFEDTGMYQSMADPQGIDGDYNFHAWYLTNTGTLRVKVLGLNASHVVIQSYVDEHVFSSSWNLFYRDFTVDPSVTSLEVHFHQYGGSFGDFLLDNISVSTASAASFVGEPVPGYTNFTDDNINLADIQDKFSVDKIKNQVSVLGSPFRLGVSTTVMSYDGNRTVYYGTSFPGPVYSETLGLSQTDSTVVGGKFQVQSAGNTYYATVMDNDPSTNLYGPTPVVQGVSQIIPGWTVPNTSYYYRVTAVNANGESTPGPITALSFDSGQPLPQITLSGAQDCQHFRVYRALSTFASGNNISYCDLYVSPSLPLVFLDQSVYSFVATVPSSNHASKPASIYLDGILLDASSFPTSGHLSGAHFIIYPFENVYQQQAPTVAVIDPNLIIPINSSYSYTFNYSKTPVYVNTTPTSWNYIGPGFYRTPEGIELGYNNLNDSGGSVSYIGLNLDTARSVLYPFGGTLWFTNTGTGPLQVTDISVSAPVMTQTGSFQVIAVNQPLIDQIGLKDETITNPFIQSISLAAAIADRVLKRWSGPGREYDLDLPNRAPLHLQLGDKITIWDDKTTTFGIPFLITRIETTFDGGASAKISCVSVD